MRKVVKDGMTQLNAKVPYELYRQVERWCIDGNVRMQDAVAILLTHAIKNPPQKP